MRAFLRFFLLDQRGVTSIEYGLIVMAVALGFMAAYFLIGDALGELMTHAASGVDHARSQIAN